MTPESYIHAVKGRLRRLVVIIDEYHPELKREAHEARESLDDLDSALWLLSEQQRSNPIPLQIQTAPIWKRWADRLKHSFARPAA